MNSYSVVVERKDLDPLCAVLKALAEYLGSVYELEERIEVTVRTEDPCLAETMQALLKDRKPVQAVVKDPVTGSFTIPTLPELDEETPEVTVLPPGIESSTVEHHDGLVACDVKERSAVCSGCGQSFIRRQKNQEYCMKPECQKEKQRAYSRKYWDRKKTADLVQA